MLDYMNPDIPVTQRVNPDTLGNQIFIITYNTLFKINTNLSWTPLHSSIYPTKYMCIHL